MLLQQQCIPHVLALHGIFIPSQRRGHEGDQQMPHPLIKALIVCSQWPVGALVFELVAPPLEQIKTGSMHFSSMPENPY